MAFHQVPLYLCLARVVVNSADHLDVITLSHGYLFALFGLIFLTFLCFLVFRLAHTAWQHSSFSSHAPSNLPSACNHTGGRYPRGRSLDGARRGPGSAPWERSVMDGGGGTPDRPSRGSAQQVTRQRGVERDFKRERRKSLRQYSSVPEVGAGPPPPPRRSLPPAGRQTGTAASSASGGRPEPKPGRTAAPVNSASDKVPLVKHSSDDFGDAFKDDDLFDLSDFLAADGDSGDNDVSPSPSERGGGGSGRAALGRSASADVPEKTGQSGPPPRRLHMCMLMALNRF